MSDAGLSLWCQRWPQLAEAAAAEVPPPLTMVDDTLQVNGIQLTSRYDPAGEAALQAELVAVDASELLLYGFGLGDLPQLLLARSALQRLYVQVLNLALLPQQIRQLRHYQWLADPRVTLFYSADEQQPYQPCAIAIGDLLCADSRMEPLCDRLQLLLNQPFISAQHQQPHEPVAGVLHPQTGADDSDVRLLWQFPWPPRAWVVAAGPSLDESWPLIKRWRRSGEPLVAVDAAAALLVSHGLVPDVVVAIDGCAAELFTPQLYQALAGSALVHFPSLDPHVLSHWCGPRYRSLGSAAQFDVIYRQQPATRLFCSGSVVHPAIDLCRQAGARQLMLAGVDFAFSDEATHAGRNLDQGYHLQPEDAIHTVAGWHDQRLKTWANFKGYLRDLESYLSQQPQLRCLLLSDRGAAIAGCELWQGEE